MSPNFALILLALALCCPGCIASSSSGDQTLRIYQLRVHGCPVMARGRRLHKAGFKISLDPLMCVTRTASLTGAALTAKFDPVVKQTYVSVPVTLADEAARGSAALKLRHESAVSVQFATLTAVSADTDPGSVYSALGFVWSQGEPVGYLRLGCNGTGAEAERAINKLVSSFRSGNFAALSRVRLSATLLPAAADEEGDAAPVTLEYRVSVPGQEEAEFPAPPEQLLMDYSVSSRSAGLEPCRWRRQRYLKPVRSVRLGNCSAMVYTADTLGGHYIIEAPICFVGVAIGADNDYSVGKPSLTLRLSVAAPKDEAILSEAKMQLADLEPKSVTLMLLWAAQRQVTHLVTRRYDIGQLMLAPDLAEGSVGAAASGLVRVHCNHVTSCRFLSSQITANSVDFWRHVTWQPVYRLHSSAGGHCAFMPAARFSVSMADLPGAARARPSTLTWEAAAWREVCVRGAPCKYTTLADGRYFVVVQQRSLGTVSFDRPWTEYEIGFGDDNDFWIGLTALHLLTSHGATLRVEMRQWNGTEMVAEYAGFTVGDASSNYRMSYREMVAAMTNVNFDAMETSKGMGFSTIDRDNDNDEGSCSLTWGRGGWWFNKCYRLYPNGMFPTTITKDWKYLIWSTNSEVIPLRWVRMMLQV